MLKSLTLKFGSKGTDNPLNFDLTPVTVFVGPNNSGKSLILKELESNLLNGNSNGYITTLRIDNDIINHETLLQAIRSFNITRETDADIYFEVINARGAHESQTHSKHQFEEQHIKESLSFASYIRYFVLRLDGIQRLDLIKEQPTSDLLTKPTNRLMELYLNAEKRNKVRELILDAFGLYFVVDITSMKSFRIRLSKRKPVDIREEEGVDPGARKFHSEAKLINEFSDGIKAYVGLLIALIAGNSKYFLVDEPEAFLHPPLSKKLGKELSKLISEYAGNLFISTHSSNFLMGCIQSGIPANIVRLTYKEDTPTAKLLPSTTLYPLLYNPILRSTGVLESLFYENVIVTEADTDRAFYDEINHRLVTFEKEKGVESCLFLNAKNIQTVSEIVKPIRDFGIPAAAIVDIDVLKNGGDEWNKLLKACNIPDISHESFQRERANIKKRFDELGKDMKKGGISLLSGSDKEACQNLFDNLKSYGIFVVPNGELESWLSYLGVSRNKHSWLNDMFNKLGSDPSKSEYVKPQDDDVWDFIHQIKTWLVDPKRKGMPE